MLFHIGSLGDNAFPKMMKKNGLLNSLHFVVNGFGLYSDLKYGRFKAMQSTSIEPKRHSLLYIEK